MTKKWFDFIHFKKYFLYVENAIRKIKEEENPTGIYLNFVT